jgi:hypothetical protein
MAVLRGEAATAAEHPRNTGNAGESPAWRGAATAQRREADLPHQRGVRHSNGRVAFLVFVAILLAYFSSATSWAPW